MRASLGLLVDVAEPPVDGGNGVSDLYVWRCGSEHQLIVKSDLLARGFYVYH